MFIALNVPESSVAVRFRNGDFYDVLRPGKHYVRGPRFGARCDRVVFIDRKTPSIEPAQLEEAAFEPALEEQPSLV